MNRHWCRIHLIEAHEEIGRVLEQLDDNSDYDEEEYQAQVELAYAHLNAAWNARNCTKDKAANATEADLLKWRRFPRELLR